MLQHCPKRYDKFFKNLSIIKKYEDAIEKHIPTIKTAVKQNAGMESIILIKAFDPDITDKDIENKYSEIYFNLKIAFYNKGFVIREFPTIHDSKAFKPRYKTSEDRCPITIDDLKCDRLIITKDVIKAMEELKDLTANDRLEHGFSLLYGEDCRIFPTEISTGITRGDIIGEIPIEGYIIFGWVHTHFWSTRRDSEYYITENGFERNYHITPSDSDIMINIDLYLDEKEFNRAIMIILSNIGNKGLILVPKKNVSDKIYRDMYNLIKVKYMEYILDFLNLISEIYHIIEFSIPSIEDIIIGRDILYS
jgi:hypothetical protein